MHYQSIEKELWSIFTFYSLHSDPNEPEKLRPAHFVRFAKDCQITSKNITPTAVELEIARLARVKYNITERNVTIEITFADFIQLLELLAVKIYPSDAPSIAMKRILLENVFLLANRRVPTNDLYDISNQDVSRYSYNITPFSHDYSIILMM